MSRSKDMKTAQRAEIMDTKVDAVKVESLMIANGLNYRMPKNVNVVEKRSMIKSSFNKSNYPNTEQPAILIINAGNNFIDPTNSYFVFSLGVDVGASTYAQKNATWGQGSAANIIRSIVLTTSSGTEVERVENVNLLRRLLDNYECGKDWFNSYGAVMGYPYDSEYKLSYVNNAAANADAVAYVKRVKEPSVSYGSDATQDSKVARTWVIPLSKLCGLFASKKLLPAGLVSGMKVEIQWETPENAFHCSGTAWDTEAKIAADIPTYNIINPAFMLDSYQLASGILRDLNMIAASNTDGLEIVFETWDHNNQDTTNSINIDSKTAAGRAQTAIAITRNTNQINAFLLDTMKARPWVSGTNFGFNVGGVYLPNQQISNDAEAYTMAIYFADKLKNCNNPSNVSYSDFLSLDADVNTGDNVLNTGYRSKGLGVMAMTLEKSNLLGLSGLRVGAGSYLQLKGAFANNADNKRIDLFMSYIAVAKIYDSRIVVRY